MLDETTIPPKRPDILLMLREGLPDQIEAEVRTTLNQPDLNLKVIRQPGGPFDGVELYLPTAIGLFVAAGFFNGFLQEAGKDAYAALKEAAKNLWHRASELNIRLIGTSGKISKKRQFSLVYSITGEVATGLNFKFLVQAEISHDDAEDGISAFIDLIADILNERLTEQEVQSLLACKPIGGTVLVKFDTKARMIVPVDPFEDLVIPNVTAK